MFTMFSPDYVSLAFSKTKGVVLDATFFRSRSLGNLKDVYGYYARAVPRVQKKWWKRRSQKQTMKGQTDF